MTDTSREPFEWYATVLEAKRPTAPEVRSPSEDAVFFFLGRMVAGNTPEKFFGAFEGYSADEYFIGSGIRNRSDYIDTIWRTLIPLTAAEPNDANLPSPEPSSLLGLLRAARWHTGNAFPLGGIGASGIDQKTWNTHFKDINTKANREAAQITPLLITRVKSTIRKLIEEGESVTIGTIESFIPVSEDIIKRVLTQHLDYKKTNAEYLTSEAEARLRANLSRGGMYSTGLAAGALSLVAD